MSTPHNEANTGDIAKTVIMPGDPLRAKYIAENFLQDTKLVNQVRSILAYTGTYKNQEVTIMASGMGMPSMAIYSYELYKFYNVENIIRIGSCGAYKPDMKLFDIVLSTGAYSEGNYALTFNNDNCHYAEASINLNKVIEKTATNNDISIYKGNTVCLDFFDPYMPDLEQFINRLPKDLNPYAGEMEAFSLFYNAKVFNKNASCLMTVVDSKFIKDVATIEQREIGLNNMIKLALNSAVLLGTGLNKTSF